MKQNSGPNETTEQHVRDIHRATRKKYSAEVKIRIVLAGLRGEYSISELCRREGIAESLYYSWSKEFLEAGKRRLAGDTERQANSGEVKGLRHEMGDLKELVAELMLDKLGVSWPTFYRWYDLYRRFGEAGLEDHRSGQVD